MKILITTPVTEKALERIAAVDTKLNVIDAGRWFDCEFRDSWPEYTLQRYIGDRKSPESTRKERDSLLSTAEIILGGWPYPKDLLARSPRLRWFHQVYAGASNLLGGDLWGSDVTVTTSRGYGNIRPMAEFVLASFLLFARDLHRAFRDQQRHDFDRNTYRPLILQGKTVCIVGAGGIGREVAKLCADAGMRVVGTRRRPPEKNSPPSVFARLEGPDLLYELLGESEFVAVCCQWTPETTKLIGKRAFSAMKPDTVLVNVARGEIIDEEALVDTLAAGKLRGVALDVYVGEFEHDPPPRLRDDERVLITPHVSGVTERSQHRGIELFCDNLRAFLDGRPLKNVIDWNRGY
jgi:phosphoglycerate dehydrogenase-like enzyme